MLYRGLDCNPVLEIQVLVEVDTQLWQVFWAPLHEKQSPVFQHPHALVQGEVKVEIERSGGNHDKVERVVICFSQRSVETASVRIYDVHNLFNRRSGWETDKRLVAAPSSVYLPNVNDRLFHKS